MPKSALVTATGCAPQLNHPFMDSNSMSPFSRRAHHETKLPCRPDCDPDSGGDGAPREPGILVLSLLGPQHCLVATRKLKSQKSRPQRQESYRATSGEPRGRREPNCAQSPPLPRGWPSSPTTVARDTYLASSWPAILQSEVLQSGGRRRRGSLLGWHSSQRGTSRRGSQHGHRPPILCHTETYSRSVRFGWPPHLHQRPASLHPRGFDRPDPLARASAAPWVLTDLYYSS